MIMRPDTRHVFARADVIGGDYDVGLEHNHNWARERTTAGRHEQLVADASAARVPSSVTHDDAIYAG